MIRATNRVGPNRHGDASHEAWRIAERSIHGRSVCLLLRTGNKKNNACMTSVDRSIRFAWRCMADGCNATRCHRFGCGCCRLWLRVIIKWPIIFPSTLRSQIGRVSLTVVSVNFLRRMFLNLNNTYFNIGCKLMDRSNLVLTRLLVRRVIAIFKKICLKDSKDSIIINDD